MNEKSRTGVLTTLQQFIHDLGLQPAFNLLLAPGSPLAIISAQALYLSEPVLSAFVPNDRMAALLDYATHLEDVPVSKAGAGPLDDNPLPVQTEEAARP